MPIAYLGLGTNLGDRRSNIDRALRSISRVASISRVSPVYETAPVGYLDQPEFWNLVVRVSTALPPLELMLRLKQIERDMGRTPTFRNGPRLIDIDILFYGDEVIEEPTLQVPHPRALERAFVLRPLADIAPDLVDPRTGKLLSDHPSDLRDRRILP